jgi:amphi-Trp domain-containing protein
VPKVEFKRKTRLSRQEAADRLIALGNALSSGSEIELGAGEDTLKLGVAAHLNWELEIEIDGDETELEIEIKWTDDPSNDAKPAAAQGPPIPRRRRPPWSPLTIPRLLPRSPPRRAADVPARSSQPDVPVD